MHYKDVIVDAIADFNNNNSDDNDKFSNSRALERICEHYKELDAENIYGLCMYYLYYFRSDKENDGALSDDSIEESFIKILPTNFNELLSRIELFKWIPASFSKVLKLSLEIFEEAKEVYYNENASANDAEEKFKEIVDLKTEIENEDYKYRNRNDILEEYETVLSECILDIDTIKGERSVHSIRLGNYIEEVGETSEVQIPPEFSEIDPFSVPEKLF